MDLKVQIVAVDDDPNILAYLQEALESDRAGVLTTQDPSEGWNLIQRTHPDIALCTPAPDRSPAAAPKG